MSSPPTYRSSAVTLCACAGHPCDTPAPRGAGRQGSPRPSPADVRVGPSTILKPAARSMASTVRAIRARFRVAPEVRLAPNHAARLRHLRSAVHANHLRPQRPRLSSSSILRRVAVQSPARVSASSLPSGLTRVIRTLRAEYGVSCPAPARILSTRAASQPVGHCRPVLLGLLSRLRIPSRQCVKLHRSSSILRCVAVPVVRHERLEERPLIRTLCDTTSPLLV